MPDKAGAFLLASRIMAAHGGNIVRVNYNRAVDTHTLFIEVAADEAQHERITRELEACGYLAAGEEERQILMIVLKLPDSPGAVTPILEILNGRRVNISYISSQENGTGWQHFKMGLLIENTEEIQRLIEEISRLCAIEPPCGSNTYALEYGGELLFIDCGFACYRQEMTSLLSALFPGFFREKKARVYHARGYRPCGPALSVQRGIYEPGLRGEFRARTSG